jgi:peptidoglycan/LPS O-acetylase OafA/YrhL
MQMISFPFSSFEQIGASVGVFLLSFYLISYPPQKNPVCQAFWGQATLKIMGRRSLELYVLHLFILKIWALYKFPESYNLWNFSLF